MNDIKFRLSVSGAEQVAAAVMDVDRTVGQLSARIGNMAHLGVGITALSAAFRGAAQQFALASDAVATLNNRLKLATGSAASARLAFEPIYGIARDSRVSFTELGGTYASMARATADLGISQQRLLKVTQATCSPRV